MWLLNTVSHIRPWRSTQTNSTSSRVRSSYMEFSRRCAAIIVAAAAEGDAAPREDIPYDFTLQIANGGIPHGAGVYWVSALLPLAAHSCPPAQRRLVT